MPNCMYNVNMKMQNQEIKSSQDNTLGDTVSVNGLMSEESTEECVNYYKEPKSLITLRGNFLKSAETNLVRLVMYNLTRDVV